MEVKTKVTQCSHSRKLQQYSRVNILMVGGVSVQLSSFVIGADSVDFESPCLLYIVLRCSFCGLFVNVTTGWIEEVQSAESP